MELVSTSLEPAARSKVLMEAAREHARAIAEQSGIARQLMAASRELVSRASVAPTLPFIHPLRATETSGPASETAGSARTFAAVTELIRQVERSKPSDADIVSDLVAEILLATRNLPDPSLLVGILLQAVVQTVHERYSVPEQHPTAIALCTLLWDHIMAGRSDTAT